MIHQTWLLFYILLLLALGAVIAFSYTVIKPLQTRWAVKRGREIAASGKIRSRWQFENTYRMLATASHDLEAAYLWQELKEIKEKTEKQA
ncbi:hypothetical protein ACFLXF_03555 [Chloroflexota bacterium]